MQVRIEDVSPVEKKMFVEVPWDTVSTKLGQAYRELGKDVALKGFRKGKVPRPVLEQVYGPRIHAEVAYQLVRESFFQAAASHQLDAVAEPRVEDAAPIKKGQPFVFSAIVEVRGVVEPQGYQGLAIERRRLAVADSAVDEAIKTLQREHTELEPITGRTETAAGDVVEMKIDGHIGEHPISQPKFAIDLDTVEAEPLPGLCAALLGLPLDTANKVIELEVPADYKDENLRGRKATLTVTFSEVRAKSVPALDDEFAKDTGKAETLDGLRAAVRKELEERENVNIHREAKEGALRALVKGNQIPVASSLVERAVEIQYNRMRQMLGMKPDTNLAGLGEDLRGKLRGGGADEVRGQLLLEAVGDLEKLEVSDADVDAYLGEQARSRNMAPARLRAEWTREGRLDGVRFSLRQDKILDFLVAKASVTEVDKLTELTPPPSSEPAAADDVAASGDHPAAAPAHVHGPDCDH
ncbi:MAG: trigger factor [Myxococcales bacterium]|nr:trigger factor [Myxococcales bacterium]